MTIMPLSYYYNISWSHIKVQPDYVNIQLPHTKPLEDYSTIEMVPLAEMVEV